MRIYKSSILSFIALFIAISASGQLVDSTQIGKEYPYKMPFLGKQAYERGYHIQLPHGLMLNTLFNRQSIILEDFRLAFTQNDELPDYDFWDPLADLIVFGPSEGRINTLNVRFDTWLLPFFGVSGYYGQIFGEQTVTLTSPVPISSVTDLRGQYYGFNLIGIAPLGPVNLAVDYSWSWTTNDRLDNPVLVKVSGMRLIRRVMSKSDPDRFFAFWAGAQFQNLASQTSGKIALDEALNLDGDALQDMDDAWIEYMNSPEWDELGPLEQAAAEARYNLVRGFLGGLAETTVHYEFNKRLEFEWNMVIGAQYQFNPTWQIRGEYGFLQSKQQAMFSVNYRFGL